MFGKLVYAEWEKVFSWRALKPGWLFQSVSGVNMFKLHFLLIRQQMGFTCCRAGRLESSVCSGELQALVTERNAFGNYYYTGAEATRFRKHWRKRWNEKRLNRENSSLMMLYCSMLKRTLCLLPYPLPTPFFFRSPPPVLM